MTPSINNISARTAFVAGQPPEIAAKQEGLNFLRRTPSASRTRRWFWHAPTLFEAFAGILALSYLVAVAALAGALLFYTFNR